MVSPDALNEQYRALLDVSESIAVHHDLAELFRDLAQRGSLASSSSPPWSWGCTSPSKNVMRLHVLEDPRPMPVSPGPRISCRRRSRWLGVATSAALGLQRIFDQEKPDFQK